MHFSGGPADPTHRLAAGWGTQLENTSELKVEAPFRLSCEGSYTLVSAFPPPFFPPPSPPPLWALHGVSSPSPLDSPLRRCRQGGTLQIAFPPLISPLSFPLGVRQPGSIFPSSLSHSFSPPGFRLWMDFFGYGGLRCPLCSRGGILLGFFPRVASRDPLGLGVRSFCHCGAPLVEFLAIPREGRLRWPPGNAV